MKKLYTIGQVIFVSLVVIIAIFVLSSFLPIPGNIEVKIVQSGSMEPAIKTGSIVVIKSQKLYKDGDVVTFGLDTKKDVPTTHRIIASRVIDGTTYFTTKGDANEDKDIKEIKSNEVIGKVILSLPFLGYIIDFARQPLGFILLIGLPALYVVYDEIRKIVGEVKKIKTLRQAQAEEKQNVTE